MTALLALIACAQMAGAQTITNTAAAQYSVGGRSYATTSNTVAFALAPPQTVITTYKPAPGGEAFGYTAPVCGGSAIVLPGASATGTSIAALTPTHTIRVGEALYFSLSAPAANLDPAVQDTLVATITTPSGDRETLTIRETAVNSGQFMGAIPTRAIPPQPVPGDCRLSLRQGETITIALAGQNGGSAIATAQVDVLADPYGLVFDSEDGTPVSGARVSLVDAITGAPARVFADDGVTPWPSTVISGQAITDGAGNVYPMAPGEYRFPLVALGRYRLVIEPPAPYTAPSAATPAQLFGLLRPDGQPFVILDASYGGALQLIDATAIRVDIPLDHPALGVAITKTASRAVALPGDVVFYTLSLTNPDTLSAKRNVTVVDSPSSTLRLRPDSVRVDGVAAPGAVQASADGRTLTVRLGDVPAGMNRTVTYAMTVRPDAPAGIALNRATATDALGRSATAQATVRIAREDIAARVTIIGRITDGGCSADGRHNPVPGVRVVMEDGSFAVTDADGRYHFAGVVPGTHVVQAQASTLPSGGDFADCTRSTRSAGNPASRFVMARGGMLVTADFVAALPQKASVTASHSTQSLAYGTVDDLPMDRAVSTDLITHAASLGKPDTAALEREQRLAAGAETDWFAKGDGPNDFLFPAIDHNPRAPAIRVVLRHRVGQTVELSLDGKPVDKLAYEGARTAPGGTYALSIWRGLPLNGEQTRLMAVVRDANGVEVSRLTRTVYYAATPARIEFVPGKSRLVADGRTRPVLALRVLDHNGRPVHAGLTGEFSLSQPYESADALDMLQQRQLAGAGRQAPRWVVRGDDGVAYVELAPTMVSGKLRMEFNFNDGQQRRRQDLETWIAPGDQPWTVVGLVEGSVGKQTVRSQMERTNAGFASDLGERARAAVYAKGPLGKGFLVTGSYDSAKQKDDQELLGTIDPRAYYSVFADGSDRRFDAASRDKVYLRLENRGFYALYGDTTSGFDQTQLGRYQRVATGMKSEFEAGGIHLQGFAAKVASTHRRDEFQGGGLTGPYRLSSRAILPGSEVVSLEVRDRLRSEVIVSRRALVRFVDYDIDLLSGTITFKEPILSRDNQLNPRFIVIDYEVDEGAAGGQWNGGLRADATLGGGAVRVGATAIRDTGANNGTRTDLVAVDLRARLDRNTELRAEAARSYNAGAHADAWLVELEHHSARIDVLAYVRQAADAFGLGQSSAAELGRRKAGVDARYRITPDLSVTTSGWIDDSLTDGSRRVAVQTGLTWQTKDADARIAVAHIDDQRSDGTTVNSTAIEGSVARRFLDNKLELSAATSFAVGGTGSVDLPERHRFSARYAVTPSVNMVGTYEIALGDAVDARTGRIGIEASPWGGARIVGAVGQQAITELGTRSFANFGLTQSVPVTRTLSLDATLDSSKTIKGFDPAHLINPDHPASSGGTIGDYGTLAEDYTAVTVGGAWRKDLWNATVRGEWRQGDLATRKGASAGLIRQLGEGQMLGGAFTWTRADAAGGLSSQVIEGQLAIASRPADSEFAYLGKLQVRSDKVTGAVAGEAGPAGRGALLVTGDAQSDRIVFSLSGDWTPRRRVDGQWVQRDHLGFFLGARHTFDAFQQYDIAGTTLLGGLDLRLGLGDRVEIGGSGTIRYSLTDKTASYTFGPQIGLSPAKDTLLLVGYNVTGFRDPDFSGARQTDQGLYAAIKIKFDASTFSFLGLGR